MSAKLPELPKPWDLQHDDDGMPQVLYTADQMREYGRACALAAEPLPKEPPPGLLMSMAIRYDHGLGMPGFYDSGIYTDVTGITHAQRLDSTLRTMRQLYEEVSGHGFYRPELEADYAERGIGGKE